MATQSLPDKDVIHFCANYSPSDVISGVPQGNLILRLTSGTVVKFGSGVTSHEAENQIQAYQLIDRRVARVPRVHRFFQDQEGRGYLVMDYINGKVMNECHGIMIQKVAGLLDHLSTIHGTTPGSLSGGPSRGIIFPDTEDVVFHDTKSIELWLNSRLPRNNRMVSLQKLQLVLCHLDIAPRNILLCDDGEIFVLDWASVGFYPRIFELCSQMIMGGKDSKFNNLVLDAMQEPDKDERSQLELLLLAWRGMQRYSFKCASEPDPSLVFPLPTSQVVK